MSVYVDKLIFCLPTKKWRWYSSCHLWADSIEELHVFAKKLGLKRAWFQDKTKVPHYDLTENMRFNAIRKGALEKEMSELSAFGKELPNSKGE